MHKDDTRKLPGVPITCSRSTADFISTLEPFQFTAVDLFGVCGGCHLCVGAAPTTRCTAQTTLPKVLLGKQKISAWTHWERPWRPLAWCLSTSSLLVHTAHVVRFVRRKVAVLKYWFWSIRTVQTWLQSAVLTFRSTWWNVIHFQSLTLVRTSFIMK